MKTDSGEKIERALILSGGGARGAYQVGVLRHLEEIGWKPDLICGTSIGAINAAAIGAGNSIEEMARLWQTYNRDLMYRFRWPIFFRSLFNGRRFSPACDTRPMKRLLEKHIDIAALRHSRTKILITALNMNTGQIRFFSHRVIGIEHLMAASAIPMLFPWQMIEGVPHWDAGIMVNTPIRPAIAWGAREIIVVLHSPIGAFNLETPQTRQQTGELAFEHFLIGSYTAMLPTNCWIDDPNADMFETPMLGSPQMQLALNGAKLGVVAPKNMLGFRSFLNFTPAQARMLIKEGHANARMQLMSFFRDSPDQLQ